MYNVAMEMGEGEALVGHSVKRDDAGWREARPSFGLPEEFAPYVGYDAGCRINFQDGKEDVFIISKEEFSPNLEAVSEQIARGIIFFREVVPEFNPRIVKVSSISDRDEKAYLRYDTSEGMLFSQLALEDMISKPIVVQAAIAHELVHLYLDIKEKQQPFKEAVPLMFQFCYLVLHGGAYSESWDDLARGENGDNHADDWREAKKIIQGKFGDDLGEMDSGQLFSWLRENVDRKDIISLLSESLQNAS